MGMGTLSRLGSLECRLEVVLVTDAWGFVSLSERSPGNGTQHTVYAPGKLLLF